MNRIKQIMHEPLVHFLLIGAVLFLVYHFTNDPADDNQNRIVVTAGQVEQMEEKFSRTWMRSPTKEEMAGLIESYVRDEIYYREAVAMGLDQKDQSIRQRMRIKLEYLLEDLSDVAESDDDVLTAFMQEHQERYRLESRVSFRQLYLNPEKRQDMQADVKRIMARLQQGEPPESLGDSTMVPGEYRLATESDIERQFGEPFARQLVALTPGVWTGPLYSGLGGHLVKVTVRQGSRLPDLAEVRSQVERDYQVERRQELKDRTYQRLRTGYEVIVDPPAPAAAENGSRGAVAVSLPKRAGQ